MDKGQQSEPIFTPDFPKYAIVYGDACRLIQGPNGKLTAEVYVPERDTFVTNPHFIASVQCPNEDEEHRVSSEEFYHHVSLQRLEQEARKFAIRAHGAQRYGEKPYSVHLEEVVSWMRSGYSYPVRAAAYLHDVLEDCPQVTAKDIEKQFGAEVAELVVALTRLPGCSVAEYFQQIRAAGRDAVAIKMADRLANVTACVFKQPNRGLFEKYRQEQPLFRSILYVPSHMESSWRRLEDLLDKGARDLLGHE